MSGSGQQQPEPNPAEAGGRGGHQPTGPVRQNVGVAEAAAQALPYLGQHTAAVLVPYDLVDVVKPVQPDHQHGQLPAAQAGGGQGTSQDVAELAPVRQSRNGILTRVTLQTLACLVGEGDGAIQSVPHVVELRFRAV